MTRKEMAQKCAVSFWEFLDEFRLINFILDKLENLYYTLDTVKKGDIENEVYSY